MNNVVEAQAISHFKIRVKFSDGIEGVVDLSHLAGKGVFKNWLKKGAFEKVYIDAESGAVCWDKNIDVCPDTLYMKITHKKVEDVFPCLK